MRTRMVAVVLCVLVGATAWAADDAATPQPLVDAYGSLADTILGAKKTEWNLVHAILATTYGHAEATLAKAKGKLAHGEGVQAEIEALAALVAQLGNEGDASVAAVRKRLIEGGHHHHAMKPSAEPEFDEGFVIVNRKVKKAFLDGASKIARLGSKPSAADLDAAWKPVADEFARLHAGH